MLERHEANKWTRQIAPQPRRSGASSWSELGQSLSSLRFRLWIIVCVALAVIAGGIGVVIMRNPQFTAAAMLVTETRSLQMVQDAVFTSPTQPGNAIQTEIELLRSPTVVRQAFDRIRSPGLEAFLDATRTSQLSFSR